MKRKKDAPQRDILLSFIATIVNADGRAWGRALSYYSLYSLNSLYSYYSLL